MNLKIIVLISLLIISKILIAQEKLCSHDESTLNDKLLTNSKYSLELNIDAFNYIKDILEVSNLPMNFVVQKISKANNAYAYSDSDGTRYILYDDKFLNSLNSDSTNTEFITVLAHEIGHHLAGHSLAIDNFMKLDSCIYWSNSKHKSYDISKKKIQCSDYLLNKRKKETEADVFAGYIMSNLKFDKLKVKNTFTQISSNRDDTNSTHPKLSTRHSSIDRGYKIALDGKNDFTSVIQKIRIDTIKYNDSYLQRVKRKQLIDRIKSHATHKALSIVNQKSLIKINNGSFSYGENKGRIDNKKLYLEPFGATLGFQDLDIGKIENLFHLKIENEILSLIMIRGKKQKTIYTSIFNEKKISFPEITNLFVVIYEALISEALENRG